MGTVVAWTLAVVAAGCRPPSSAEPSTTDDLGPIALPPPPFQRELHAGELHSFRLSLDSGDLLDVQATQEGVDLILRILAPNGEILRAADGIYRERGTERAVAMAASTGSHTLELQATGTSPSGSYTLSVTRRSATDGDRLLLVAADDLTVGDRAYQARDWQRAAAAFRLAADRWLQLNDDERACLALHQLGRARKRFEDWHGALDAYRAASRAARDAGFRAGEADLALGVGLLSLEIAEPEQAVIAFETAATLYSELEDPRRQALTVNEIAYAFERQGRLDDARRAYERALTLARQEDDASRWQGTFLTNLSWIYLRLGQTELALDLANEALDLRRRNGDRRGQGITLTTRATALRRLGRLAEARDTFLDAWRLLLAEQDAPKRANALVGLGLTDLESGRLERAEHAFTSALALHETAGRQRSSAIVRLDLAEVHLAHGDGERARALASRALGTFDALADRQGQAGAYYALAHAERLLGRLEIAFHYSNLALDQMESIRQRAGVDRLRSSYLAFRHEYYEQAIDLLMALHQRQPAAGWTVRAVETLERSRARNLRESVLLGRADLLRKLDPALREREERATARLIDLEEERLRLDLKGADAAISRSLDGQLRQAELDLAEAREALRASDRAAAELLVPSPFDAERFIRSNLDAQTVLLEISLGQQQSHIFWLDRDGIVGFALPGQERLDRLARLTHGALQNGNKPIAAGQADRALQELSRELLGPLAPRLAGQRLVVVADGALHYVPFAALPDPRYLDDDEPPRLIEHHEVVSLPSAAILETLRRPRKPASGTDREPKTVAVVADPVFHPNDPRLTSSAEPQDNTFEPLQRLPFTADEAEAILDLVPKEQGLSAIGFEARLDLLVEGRLAAARILHFATHARLHAEIPQLSALELSRYDVAGRRQPGTLYAHRIYGLPLGADLVVLSACKTALGREVRGEGLVGLTHGFFQAGASRMVVSLWSVDDQATTELMISFYRHLLSDDMPPAQALRTAQLELRADDRWSAPYYWAGFILLGDWL